MKISKLALVCYILGIARASGVATSWAGELPYLVYADGDGCTASSVIGNGTAVGLVATKENFLCETDMIKGTEAYFGIAVGPCGDANSVTPFLRDKALVTMYNCDSSMCSSCDYENPALLGYFLPGYFNANSISSVDYCFGWGTVTGSNETAFAQLEASTSTLFEQFVPPSSIQDKTEYLDVFMLNSCLGAYVGYQGAATNTSSPASNGNDAVAEIGDSPSPAPGSGGNVVEFAVPILFAQALLNYMMAKV